MFPDVAAILSQAFCMNSSVTGNLYEHVTLLGALEDHGHAGCGGDEGRS